MKQLAIIAAALLSTQTAFLDRSHCESSDLAYVAVLETDRTWNYSAPGPFSHALALYHKRLAKKPAPDEIVIRCDVTPYQPTHD